MKRRMRRKGRPADVIRGRARWCVIRGDCREVLSRLPPAVAEALVTDPPAGISFMGKEWDDDKGGRDEWVSWMADIMRECLRVLKPGAHGLVWALPRTAHWTGLALEDAGFEVRDVVVHLFGTGFPKSLDVSKALDAAAGARRRVLGHRRGQGSIPNDRGEWGLKPNTPVAITAPATPLAAQWNGWGTALKPAAEHWILVRKPLEGTVAANVARHGTGALNIDGCRVGTESTARVQRGTTKAWEGGAFSGTVATGSAAGRWPANVLLDEDAARELDAQSGFSVSPGKTGRGASAQRRSMEGALRAQGTVACPSDSGGASRFFYVAKASRRERGPGNTHPTVKPVVLMRYLLRLVTPAGGLVVDPFAGTGTTGVAARLEGARFIGIEAERTYVRLATRRIREAA